MAIYYHIFGLVADLVLLANVVLLAALLSMMRASLSLPGIAGIILTVGMAVDANVLIYERIREELRKGVSPQAAIRAGFDKAFSAIVDSNITTLIAGVVLWVLGTGPIRGFAVVLTLGIVTSMFTSLMGSRALITLMYGGRRKLARLSIESTRAGRGPTPRTHRGIFQSSDQLPVHGHTQGVVRPVGDPDDRLARLLFTRGLNLAIDFTGGVSAQATFPATADVDAVRTAARGRGLWRCRRCRISAPRATSRSACRRIRSRTAGGAARALEAALKAVDPGAQVQQLDGRGPAGRQ